MDEIFETGLAGAQFLPQEPWAALVIVHGLGEHCGRYRFAAERLRESGIACFTYDQRGHGESPGPRTQVDHFSDFANDLAGVVDGVRQRYPALPLFSWGHSLGSIVLLSYVLGNPAGLSGGITSGCPLTALGKTASALSRLGSGLFARLPPIRINSRLDPVLLSHDATVQAAYRDDPLVSTTVTLHLVFGLAFASRQIRQRAHEIRMPWLAIHGSEDQIAPPEGSRILIDNLGAHDKKLVVMEQSRHEVQNEGHDLREQFLGMVVDWIRKRAGHLAP